jgi:hypothetical protein
MGSYSDSNSSQYFSRTGSNTQVATTDVDPFFSSLLRKNATDADVPTQLTTDANTFLGGLVNRNNAAPPGVGYLNTSLNDVDPNNFQGRPGLVNQAGKDPFTSTYEDATSAKYLDRVRQGIAQVNTGPDVVRGGTARSALASGEAINRMALERADEVRRAQLQDATIQQQATQMLNAIESGRRATLLTGQGQLAQQFLGGAQQGLGAAEQVHHRNVDQTSQTAMTAKLLGGAKQLVTEAMQGYGSGTTSGFNAGVNCCFVFLEAYDGVLPWYVRRARDIFYAERPSRKIGYVRMSSWLVPMMKRWPFVKALVRAVLIKPLSKYGAWFFGESGAKPRWKFYEPYVKAWFKLWELGGRI